MADAKRENSLTISMREVNCFEINKNLRNS